MLARVYSSNWTNHHVCFQSPQARSGILSIASFQPFWKCRHLFENSARAFFSPRFELPTMLTSFTPESLGHRILRCARVFSQGMALFRHSLLLIERNDFQQILSCKLSIAFRLIDLGVQFISGGDAYPILDGFERTRFRYWLLQWNLWHDSLWTHPFPF